MRYPVGHRSAAKGIAVETRGDGVDGSRSQHRATVAEHAIGAEGRAGESRVPGAVAFQTVRGEASERQDNHDGRRSTSMPIALMSCIITT